MIDFLQNWATATWGIVAESGPFLLLGFVIAGFLKVLIPQERVFRFLGQDNFRSVFIASIFGVPVPLCSCSVIPTAIALKRSGASKGATTSFMISTPETGVDSIGITWALMDPIMTIARPLIALLSAVGCGTAVNILRSRGWDGTAPADLELPTAEGPQCKSEQTIGSKIQQALSYSFGTLLDDLTPSFLIGFLGSGLITLLIPADFFGSTLPTGWISMLVMLVAGIPFYVCAAASTPIAAALIAKGLDPGAALVLLLAGPATNLATMAVVHRFLGKRVLIVYVTGISVFALLGGVVINHLYQSWNRMPTVADSVSHHGHLNLLAITSGAILSMLLVFSAIRSRLLQRWLQKVLRRDARA